MSLDKEEINKLLKYYKVKRYTINEDLSVDVNGNVDLSDNELDCLPIVFNTVSGNFIANRNNLKSFDGFPKKLGGSLSVSNNNISSFKNAPEVINGNFSCMNNKIIDFKDFPSEIKGNVLLLNNLIENFEIINSKISGYIYVDTLDKDLFRSKMGSKIKLLELQNLWLKKKLTPEMPSRKIKRAKI